jgi:hypothetical protein
MLFAMPFLKPARKKSLVGFEKIASRKTNDPMQERTRAA